MGNSATPTLIFIVHAPRGGCASSCPCRPTGRSTRATRRQLRRCRQQANNDRRLDDLVGEQPAPERGEHGNSYCNNEPTKALRKHDRATRPHWTAVTLESAPRMAHVAEVRGAADASSARSEAAPMKTMRKRLSVSPSRPPSRPPSATRCCARTRPSA
eukprot:6408307-Prymnesium_polylepis.2